MFIYDGDILVVDDSPELCGVFKNYFHKTGFNIDICNSIDEYKSIYINKVYKVTLIDVILSNNNSGIELLSILPKQTVPIFMSGYIASILGNYFYHQKIRFISKPLLSNDIDSIVDIINNIKS